MTRVLYLDCIGGLAGDMLLAALVDVGASLEAIQAGLPVEADLAAHRAERHGMTGIHLTIDAPDATAHRRLSDILALIDAGTMPERVAERARATFQRLAAAEAAVHRVDIDQVTFHEVGALDAIVDICGVSLALEDLGIEQVVGSPLPLGRGITRSAHGLLATPAPATLALLDGVPVQGVDVDGETVTPTGAALAVSHCESFGACPAMLLGAVGVGVGTSDWPTRPNVVRALVGTSVETQPAGGGPLILETNLDDMPAEWVPEVLAACMAAGAHDAWTTPALMKNGRPGLTMAVLTPAAAEEPVARALLRHSTTLGLRVRRVEHRWGVDRHLRDVTVDGHEVSVKVAVLDGEVVNIKPEHRDCVRVAAATGLTVKQVWTAALNKASDPWTSPTRTDPT